MVVVFFNELQITDFFGAFYLKRFKASLAFGSKEVFLLAMLFTTLYVLYVFSLHFLKRINTAILTSISHWHEDGPYFA